MPCFSLCYYLPLPFYYGYRSTLVRLPPTVFLIKKQHFLLCSVLYSKTSSSMQLFFLRLPSYSILTLFGSLNTKSVLQLFEAIPKEKFLVVSSYEVQHLFLISQMRWHSLYAILLCAQWDTCKVINLAVHMQYEASALGIQTKQNCSTRSRSSIKDSTV